MQAVLRNADALGVLSSKSESIADLGRVGEIPKGVGEYDEVERSVGRIARIKECDRVVLDPGDALTKVAAGDMSLRLAQGEWIAYRRSRW